MKNVNSESRFSKPVWVVFSGVVITTAIVAFMLIPVPSSARSNVVLAEDYPYSTCSMQMARRAVADYLARNRDYPASMDELVENGYAAYHFPAQTKLGLSMDGDKLMVDFEGSSSYTHGVVTEMYLVGAEIPPSGLYYYRNEPVWVQRGNEQFQEWQDVKYWCFRGAEWLDNGFGWYDVEQALKRDRVVTHLVWASREFQYDNGFGMPNDLDELEQYVGVTRNPACWDEVQLVEWVEEVGYTPGNLFVGWDGDDWCIICNLGPETLEYRYSYGSEANIWVVKPFLGAY